MRATSIPDIKIGRPAFVKEHSGHYALWTGYEFWGGIERVPVPGGVAWVVTTPGSPPESFAQFRAACADARHKIKRATER